MAAEIILLLLKVNLAIAGAVVLVLMLRAPVRRLFGAQAAYHLWLAVPIAAAAVLIPARQVTIALTQAEALPGAAVDQALSAPAPNVAPALAPLASAIDLPALLLTVWTVGLAVSLAVLAVRHYRFLAQLAADAAGPAVIGFLRPRVVLPADFAARFDADEQRLVLAHEGQHLARGDARLNIAIAVGQCLAWFNPLVHLGAFHFRMDQELACDAAVVARFPQARRAYAQAMLKTQIAGAGLALGCYWPARSKAMLKQRIALLNAAGPGGGRAIAGALAITLISLGAGVGAWAAQPARPVAAPPVSPVQEPAPARAAPSLASRLGGKLMETVQRSDGGAEDLAEIRALIDAGADVNHRRLGDGTALIIAARTGQDRTVKLLLDKGADPNLSVIGDGNPLIVAARTGHLSVVETLIARGADVDAEVAGDETPLIGAAARGNLMVVETLVAHGAKVNHTAKTSAFEIRSPLGQARRYRHGAVVSVLIAHGAKD
ncbi:M56 family metallopeptidase [soil metagenome]